MRRKLGDAAWVLLGAILGLLIALVAAILVLRVMAEGSADMNGMAPPDQNSMSSQAMWMGNGWSKAMTADAPEFHSPATM